MGVRCSFHVVADRDRADALIRELAARVEEPYASRLLGTLPSRPSWDSVRETTNGTARPDAGGFAVQLESQMCSQDSLCLCVRVPPDPDPALARFMDEMEANGRRVFGCVYTEVRAGRELVCVTARAASSGMSDVMWASTTLHGLFGALAEAAGARAVFLERDDANTAWYRVVWPRAGHVQLPDWDDYAFIDEGPFGIDIDWYFGAALRAAGLR